MNGKRAKQIRSASGDTIANRRAQREFERRVAALHRAHDDRAFQRRRGRQSFAAVVGILFFVVALLAAVLSVIR